MPVTLPLPHLSTLQGWTVYAERRILAKIYGQEKADLHAAIGLASLRKTIQDFESQGPTGLRFTQLDVGDEGLQEIDPDEVYSVVPYEKVREVRGTESLSAEKLVPTTRPTSQPASQPANQRLICPPVPLVAPCHAQV